MANEIFKELKTRIALKYNTYEYWTTGEGKDYAPLKGEVCFCAIESKDQGARTAPTVLFKVGVDGQTKFSALKWASALAADVYDWAKVAGVNVFTKDGTGNVVSGIEYDATLNSGKGGFKFTTASVATAEGFKGLQDAIAAIEKDIAELGTLASKDKIVEGDIEGTISKDKIANFATEVAAVKVSEAGTADKVAHSFTVNGVAFDGSDDKSVTINAASLGLESAMHFIGALAEAPASAKSGDVYLNTATKKEYVYSEGQGWVELGDEGSHALKTISITGADGLTGGGTLEQDRTITHAVPSNAAEGDHKGTGERTYITNVKTDKFGHVVGIETGTEVYDGITSIDASGDAEVSLNAVKENGTVTITAAHTPHAAGEAKTASAATIADYDGTGTIKIPKIVTNAAGHVTEISEETVTITMPSRQEIPEASGNATIASVSGDVVTLKTSAVLNADHTLTNGDGEDITLAKVAKTGSAYDLAEANVGTDKDGNEVFYLVLDCNW